MNQATLLSTLVVLAAVQAGCGRTLPAVEHPARPAAPASKPAPRRLVMEPIKLQAVAGSPIHEVEAFDAATLFDQGGQLLSARRFDQALERYRKLLKNFPDSSFASSALYNSGLSHEWLGQFDRAAEVYAELIRRFGGRKEAIDASFRLGGCYAELRNWPASAEAFSTLLERQDLSVADRVEAMSRKGLAQFRLGDERGCRSTLLAVLRFHKGVDVTEKLESDFFLAMAHYYLAALPHLAFRKVQVDRGKDMAPTLDEKARHLLLSQAGYIDAIKVKNPYWATAAGFQIGSLYREFYTVLLTTLPDFTTEAKKNADQARISEDEARRQMVQVYREEVHKVVKPLLDKAIRVFEKNILMAQRVGVESNWVGKSRHQVDELKHLLTLPPEEAVKLVKEGQPTPEDQPVTSSGEQPGQPPQPSPADLDKAPARPSDRPLSGDEPGNVNL